MANKKGMDIWYHQGDINFVKAKADGISFVLPRDGWGTKDIDPKLVDYVKGAKAAGIEVPGVFHFIYGINTQEAIQNAQKAIENVKKAGLPNTTVIWCDLEYDTVDNARDYRGVNLSAKAQREMTEAFCNYVLAEGYPTGVYLNSDYLNNVYGKDIVNQYDIWLADLNQGNPVCKCVYRQVDWYGKVDGCATNMDIDEYYGQYTAGTAKPRKEATNYMIKASNLLANIHDVIDNIPTVYEQGSNWGAWNGSAFRLDCIIFVKCMVYWDWYYPDKNLAHGGATYNPNYDWTEINILNHCSNVGYGNFLSAKPGAYLYMDGHGGFKIDEFTRNGRTYNVAECTWADAWGAPKKCVYSYVDNNGGRYNYKGGTRNGSWEAHGELYGVQYDVENGTNVTPQPTKTVAELAQEVIEGKWGNGSDRKARLKAAGYDPVAVQAEVDKLIAERDKPKPVTLDINKFASFLSTVQKGNNGEAVKLVQSCLKELGFYTDSIDGSAGNNTDKAIRAYQQAAGLTNDGVFGTQCWTKMLVGK